MRPSDAGVGVPTPAAWSVSCSSRRVDVVSALVSAGGRKLRLGVGGSTFLSPPAGAEGRGGCGVSERGQAVDAVAIRVLGPGGRGRGPSFECPCSPAFLGSNTCFVARQPCCFKISVSVSPVRLWN